MLVRLMHLLLCSLCASLAAAAPARPVAAPYNISVSGRTTAVSNEDPLLTMRFDVSDSGACGRLTVFTDRVELHRGNTDGSLTPVATGNGSSTEAGALELTLKVRTDQVRVLSARRVLLICRWQSAGRGRVDYEHGPNLRLDAFRCQPLAPIVFADDFSRNRGELGVWTAEAGEWSIDGAALADFSANAFCLTAQGQPARLLAGSPFWERYRASAAVRCDRDSDVPALIVAADRGRHVAFAWKDNRLQLLLVEGDTAAVLAQQPARRQARQWYEMSACLVDGDVTCYLDKAPVASARLPGLEQGRVGLELAAEDTHTTFFDDVAVESVETIGPRPWDARKPLIKEAFASDPYMVTWTDLAGSVGEGVADYTFHAAPTDWLVQCGEWGIQSRWQCQPRWAWFGGRSREGLAVWHKARCDGDVSVDLYAAFRMDSPFDPVYRHPGDINITICGNGHDFRSGYTLRYAADRNRVTQILRHETVLAETHDALLPDNRDTFPYKGLHVPWIYMRFARRGSRLEASAGGTPILSFEDPEPLAGGRVAVWSWDNELLLARLRVESARLFPLLPVPRTPPEPDHPDTAIADYTPGTPFRLPVPTRNACSNRTPWLRVAFRGTPDTNANLYFSAGHQRCVVRLTAPSIRHDDVLPVAQVPDAGVTEHWQHVAVNLAVCLPDWMREPTGLPDVDSVSLGLESDDPMVVCGFRGGNAAGCRLAAGPAGFAESAEPGDLIALPCPMPPRSPAVAAPPGARVLTFEATSPDALLPTAAPGVRLDVDTTRPATGRRCLKITNGRLGGAFDVRLFSDPFSPRRAPRLRFDYRIDDRLRVDLLLRLRDGWRAVRFTDADSTWPVLGAIPGVVPDRQWHTAEVDLQGLLRASGLEDEEILAVSLRSTGYPGNEQGVAYRLDNVSLLPGEETALPADPSPPQITVLSPLPDAAAAPEKVTVRVQDPDSGVDWASCRLTVDGTDYHIGSASVDVAKDTGTFTWCPARVRPFARAFRDTQRVPCSFTAENSAAQPAAARIEWPWVMDLGQDVLPPAPPNLTYVPSTALTRDTFESNTGRWGDWGGCDVAVSQERAANGAGALRLTKLARDESCQALLDIKHIPVPDTPLVGLDIWIPENPAAPGKPYSFGLYKLFFDGTRDRLALLPPFDDRVEPASWSRVTVDLRSAHSEGAGMPYGLLIRHLEADNKPAGLALYVDNVTVFSPVDASPAFEWSVPPDVSGIAGYSVVFDRRPDTVPPEILTAAVPQARFEADAPGIWYCHVRAADNAGNWGAPAHCRVSLE